MLRGEARTDQEDFTRPVGHERSWYQRSWGKYLFEFASVFLAVFLAFALNNYATEQRDRKAEHRIISDIVQGLHKDLADIEENVFGHRAGLAACDYFRRLALGQKVGVDSFALGYYVVIRDFINAQNTAGYANLKSRGLEIIRDDSLRNSIVSLYEYDYSLVRKLEEEYAEQQYFAHYGERLDELLRPYITFDETGHTPQLLSAPVFEETERRELLLIMARIRSNRLFVLHVYDNLQQRIQTVLELAGQSR